MKYAFSFLLVAAVLASGGAWADGPPQTGTATDHGQHKAHNPPTAPAKPDAFATYDANGDGYLSKAELAKHPMAAHAGMVDKDKNGRLDRAEFAMLQKM